jgi:hypothetical protein
MIAIRPVPFKFWSFIAPTALWCIVFIVVTCAPAGDRLATRYTLHMHGFPLAVWGWYERGGGFTGIRIFPLNTLAHLAVWLLPALVWWLVIRVKSHHRQQIDSYQDKEPETTSNIPPLS